MLDVELALARALEHTGLAPAGAAEELAALADANALDLATLGRGGEAAATPVPALLRALRERLGDGAAAEYLHRGATSQDILDTASMLVAKRALGPLLEDLGEAAGLCAGLAERHRHRLQPGRTLLQQAAPVTVGLKAAGWLSGLEDVRTWLAEIRERELAVQLGGAVGTLAALGDRGLAVLADMAGQLGLVEPPLPWHTIRVRPARLACALGVALGMMAKVARDVILLAQTEVAELSEGGAAEHGRSSTLPHKRNPSGAVAVVACAQRAPGLVATMLSSMPQEHERGAGGWQAEWETQLQLLRLAGSAADSLTAVLRGLHLDTDRLSANLELSAGLLMSESVAAALAESLGRARAWELVGQATQTAAREGRPLREALLELDEVLAAIDTEKLDDALAPERYLGVADELIERVLPTRRGRASAS
jgi:3-carboxy-cis,cis-muconate cycloisomerase